MGLQILSAGLPHQSSPSVGYALRLGDYEALFEARFGKRSRGNFVRKERRLAEAGVLTYGGAETRDERKVRLTRKFGGVMSTGDGADQLSGAAGRHYLPA